jgi:predicted Zn-dependent peptidase
MQAMEHIDALYDDLRKERRKGAMADEQRIAQLQADLKAEQEAARVLLEDGEFEKAIERAGGSGLNATTSSDATRYFYSLPSNKTELWFSLESDRFLNPVLREF